VKLLRAPYRGIGTALGIIALIWLAPYFLSIVQIRMVNEIAYFALFAVSFNFLFGYTGLLSFGHAAYFGLGAYITALSLKHITELNPLLSIIMGGLAAAIGGAIIGFFCVRRKGGYFVLLTLAFNQLLWAVAWKWRNVTRGDDGIGGFVPKKLSLGILMLDLTKTEVVYYISMAVILLFLLLGWYLMRTPFGNTIQTIKMNEDRAAFLGYNVNFSKLLIFIISAFFAGIAGSVFALFQDYVAPSALDLGMSNQVLLIAFLGGTGSFFGPILGAAIFVYFTDWISSLTNRWEFILGVLFIVLVLYFHKGAIGLIPKKLRSIFVAVKG
jgi:branched-chain amino acid transport system permease protein